MTHQTKYYSSQLLNEHPVLSQDHEIIYLLQMQYESNKSVRSHIFGDHVEFS